MRIKRILIAIFVFTMLGAGVFIFVFLQRWTPEPTPIDSLEPKEGGATYQVIGTSFQEREIEAFTYGEGDTRLLFVGGIHGGYEWNTVLLAYAFMDYLDGNPQAIPGHIKLTVIPSANPDGVYQVVGREGRFEVANVPSSLEATVSGRFNARGVDLNRNFDCQWKREGKWRDNAVSAGSEPFSEPETQAIRDFVLEYNPAAVVFWHSQANAVYPADCGNGFSPETLDIMRAYAGASGYLAAESFDAYEVTGAADGWLASIGIPALTVELQTHQTIEWERNRAGIEALFEYYGQAKRE